MGRQAVELLTAKLSGVDNTGSTLIPPTLTVRDSSSSIR